MEDFKLEPVSNAGPKPAWEAGKWRDVPHDCDCRVRMWRFRAGCAAAEDSQDAPNPDLSTLKHARTVHTYVINYVCVYIYVCIHVYTVIYIYVTVYVYTYIYITVYVYTYIYIFYMYTIYLLSLSFSPSLPLSLSLSLSERYVLYAPVICLSLRVLADDQPSAGVFPCPVMARAGQQGNVQECGRGPGHRLMPGQRKES